MLSRVFGIAFLACAVAVGCSGARNESAPAPAARSLRQPPSGIPLLAPGSRELDVSHLRDTSFVQEIFVRPPSGDTTEKARAHMESWMRVSRREVATGFVYGSSAASIDTSSARIPSLAPIREHLDFNSMRINIVYDGKRIVRTAQHGDSAAVTREQLFAVPLFGFNELDILVSSIPLTDGYRAILPLYSEVDADVEYDTVTVLGPSLRGGATTDVRFADPAIIALYSVDRATRAIVGHTVTQRRSGARIRYAPVM